MHVLFEDGMEGFNGVSLVVGGCRGHAAYGGIDGLEGMVILSSVVTCSVGRLWGQNLTASLTMTARDSLVRTR